MVVAASVVEAVVAAEGSVPWMVMLATPPVLPESRWRSPFLSTVTTLGSPTRIEMDFVTV